MAEKKDIYYDGKIYTGITEKFAPNFKDWDTYLEIYGKEVIPVTGTHSFKDGQDVTGLYELGNDKIGGTNKYHVVAIPAYEDLSAQLYKVIEPLPKP